MEAPERIYRTTTYLDNNRGKTVWKVTPVKGAENIEYIRKDTFIEKACKYWYQYNRDIVKKHGAKAVLGCSEFTVNVGDFKKYMEE